MAKIVVRCPSCEGDLHATRLACETCGTNLDGQFEIPPLLKLRPDDLAFVTAFVRASGSLKEMAKIIGISYPTVRNRLDEIIRNLDVIEKAPQKRRHAILDALEAGKMTAEDAEKALRKVGL